MSEEDDKNLTTNTDNTDNTTTDNENGQTADEEAKASRMGWVGKDKFRGDEDQWVSAKDFIERGETHLPIMKERIKKLDQTVVGLNGTISDMKRTFREFKKYHSESEERSYKRAHRELVEKQRDAAADGNIDAFDDIEKQKETLEKEVKDKTLAAKNDDETIDDNGEAQAATDVFHEWKKGNKWFDSDDVLRQYAKALSIQIQNTDGIGGIDLYDEVAQRVKDKFPEKFSNKNRNKANSVDGGGDYPVKTKKQSFANLPKDAQDKCMEFVNEIPGFTKEEYVKSYEWE